MLLTGTYVRTLDEKSRFAIPKRLRDAMGTSDNPLLYLTPGTDGSLSLFTESAFLRMGERLGRGSPTGQDVRAFSRLFYGQAQSIEIDKQGRVRVPSELAQLASITKELVLLGVGDHLELWDRASWEGYLVGKQSSYDELAENAFDPLTRIANETNKVEIDGTARPVQPR